MPMYRGGRGGCLRIGEMGVPTYREGMGGVPTYRGNGGAYV